jgi:hypothetical protein
MAHNAPHLSFCNLEAYVFQGPDVAAADAFFRVGGSKKRVFFFKDFPLPPTRHVAPQGAGAQRAKAV